MKTRAIKSTTNSFYIKSCRYHDDFYDIWSLFDDEFLEKIPNFYDIDSVTKEQERQRNKLYNTIYENLDLFNNFKTKECVLDAISKIIKSLEKWDTFQYTNEITNIFRVARLFGDLEKGFEVYEKIKDK